MVRGARVKTASPPPGATTTTAAATAAPARSTRQSRRLRQGEGTGKSSPLQSLDDHDPRPRKAKSSAKSKSKSAPKASSRPSRKTKPDTIEQPAHEEPPSQSQSPPPSINESEASQDFAHTDEHTDDDEPTVQPETAEDQVRQEADTTDEPAASLSPSVQLDSEIPSASVQIVDLESTPSPPRSRTPADSLPDYESDPDDVETPRPSTEHRAEPDVVEAGAGEIYIRRSPSPQEKDADADTCKDDHLLSTAPVHCSPEGSTAPDHAQTFDQPATAMQPFSCDDFQTSDTLSDHAILVNDSSMQHYDSVECQSENLQSAQNDSVECQLEILPSQNDSVECQPGKLQFHQNDNFECQPEKLQSHQNDNFECQQGTLQSHQNENLECNQPRLQSHPMLKLIDCASGLPEVIFDARYTTRFIDAFATLSNPDQLYVVSLLYSNGVHRTTQLYDTNARLSQTRAALDASRAELEVKGYDAEDKEITLSNQERKLRQKDDRIEHLKRALFEARMGRGLAANVNDDDDDADTTNDLDDADTSIHSPPTQLHSRKRPAPDEPDQDLDQRQHRRLRFSNHVAQSSPRTSKLASTSLNNTPQKTALQSRSQSFAAELSDSDSSEGNNDKDEVYMSALKTLNSSRERSNRLRFFSPATEERIEKRRRHRARKHKSAHRSSLSTPRPAARVPDTLTPPATPDPQPQSASSWGFRSLLGSVTRFIPGLRGAQDPQTEPIRRTRPQITSQADVDRIFSQPANESPQSAEPGSPATPTPAGRRAPVVLHDEGDISTDVFTTPPDRDSTRMSGALPAGTHSAESSPSSSPEEAMGTQSVDRHRSRRRRPRPKRNADERARVIATGKARAETRAAATEASRKEYQEMWAEAQRRVREVEEEERLEREQATRKRKRVAIDQLKSIPHGPPGQTGTFGLLPAFFDHGSDSEESVSADESDIRMEDASPLPPSKRVRFSESDHVSRFNNDSPPASRSQGQHIAAANSVVDDDPHRARPYLGTMFADPTSSRSQTSPANNAAPYEGATFAGQETSDDASGNVFDKMHNKSADRQDAGFNRSGHFELSYDTDTESEASMLSEVGPSPEKAAVPGTTLAPFDVSPPRNVATVEDDDGNIISHAYTPPVNGTSPPAPGSPALSADNVALNPPAKPTPAHATLPGTPAPGDSDALARARSQAEKYKPKQPSGLRASSRLSNSTAASEIGEGAQNVPLPAAAGILAAENNNTGNVVQTNGLVPSQPKAAGFPATNGFTASENRAAETPQKASTEPKPSTAASPFKQTTAPPVNGIIKDTSSSVNGVHPAPAAAALSAPELDEVLRLVNNIPESQLREYTFPVGESIVCDDPVVEAAVQAAMKHPDFAARAERMFAKAMAETAAETKEETVSFLESIGVL